MKRTYMIFSESWYYQPGRENDIIISFDNIHSPDEHCGDFLVTWVDLGEHGTAARLEVFEDQWHLLPYAADIFQAMTRLNNPDYREFCDMLESLGITDVTVREDPYKVS